MKTTTTSFFALIAALASIAAVTSCAKTERIAGSWQGTPERIASLPDVADATSTMTIDFVPDAKDSRRGAADFMAVIEVSQPVSGTTESLNVPYLTNITATATVNATYVYEEGDDDDIILSFDPSTLQVNIDPDGVTFSESLISQTERPVLDSLTSATADKWRILLTSAVREQFYKYRRIEDIKVHHGDMMSCEVENRDLSFRRVGVPD